MDITIWTNIIPTTCTFICFIALQGHQHLFPTVTEETFTLSQVKTVMPSIKLMILPLSFPLSTFNHEVTHDSNPIL